jgi:hypothetical protein
MLTLAQNKTLDALEYALVLIETYDQEFEKRAIKVNKEDLKKQDQGKSIEISTRVNDVKTNYKELAYLQKERAVKFVVNTQAYKFADDKIHFERRFEQTREFTFNLYNSLNTQIIVPVQDNIVLVYDRSLKKASLMLENIQNCQLAQFVAENYSTARVTLTNNWMKLDLNNDGRVTVSDLVLAIKKIQKMVLQNKLLVKAIELPHSVHKRAIKYFEHDVRSNQGELERKLVKSDENNSSTDSIELQKLVEKDD